MREGALSPALIAFAARILALGSTFAMNVVISQTLPLAGAGTVVVVLTLVTTFATVGRFGTDNLALRVTASDLGRMRRMALPLVSVAAVATVLSSAGFLMAAGLALDNDESRGWVLLLGAASIAPAVLSVLAAAVLRGAGRFGSGTLAELGSVPLMVSLGLLLAMSGGLNGVSLAVAVVCGAYWITAAWAGVAGWRVLPASHGPSLGIRKVFRVERRSLLHFSVAALTSYFVVWIPVLSLGFVGSAEEVALYNSGARLAAFVSLVSAIQVTYLATEFAKLGALGDRAGISRVAQRSTRLATLVASLAAVALVSFPSQFLNLFGDEYASAGPVLIALTLGALVQVMAGPSIAVMLTGGQERTASRLSFLACAIAVVVCPILAASGPNAVAVAAAAVLALPAVLGAVILRAKGVHTSLAMGER